LVAQPAPIRVLIGEDQPIVREGIVRVLETSGFEVTGTAADARDLVSKARVYRPDVVVTDIQMPPDHADDGLRAALEIRAADPGVGVLVLSQFLEDRYAFDLVAEGAQGVGYLLKEKVGDLRMFTDAVRRVAEGGSALDPDVVARLVGRRLDQARVRSTGADRRRVLQRRRRSAARGHRRRRGAPRDQHLRQARAAPVTRPAPPGPGRAQLPPVLIRPGE
jgi:DNA-binding NarL/FixJ family response regulator